MRMSALVVALLALSVTGCPGSSAPPVDGECEVGRYYAPGCDEGATPAFTAGCYTPCEVEGNPCEGGAVCTVVTEHPCLCDPGENCCMACGAEALICL